MNSCAGAYQRCRALNAAHGKTFFLATRLLSPRQRPAVYTLYGYFRRADNMLDSFDAHTTEQRAAELQGVGRCVVRPGSLQDRYGPGTIRCSTP